MFSFKPLSDAELNELQNRDLIPDGIYPFVVTDVESQLSKSGNQMLKVRISVQAGPTDSRSLVDYLLTSGQMIYKLKHFCESIGFGEQYKAGIFSLKDCLNKCGMVKIGTQKGSLRPDGLSFYADKNAVKDYIVSSEPKAANAAVEFNDEIPF